MQLIEFARWARLQTHRLRLAADDSINPTRSRHLEHAAAQQ
jgi:hypothetical protein